MKAVLFGGKGGPEVIEWRDTADPAPARGEVLVRVRAAALNRADLLQRRGLYPPPPGTREDIPGLELAGEVAAVGDGRHRLEARRPRDGDRRRRGAGRARRRARADARCASPTGCRSRTPARSPRRASPRTTRSSRSAGCGPGWPVLVHAVGSGVSTAAVQIAKAAGATVIGTSRTAEKLERARALGHGPRHPRREGRAALRRRGEGGSPGSAAARSSSTSSARPTPRRTSPRSRPAAAIVVIGTMGGAKPTLDLSLLMRTRGDDRRHRAPAAAARGEDRRDAGLRAATCCRSSRPGA